MPPRGLAWQKSNANGIFGRFCFLVVETLGTLQQFALFN